MGSLTLGGFPADLGDEANRITSDTLISPKETDNFMKFIQLRSRIEHEDDEDDYDDSVAERSEEDEEAARVTSELSSHKLIMRTDDDEDDV